MDPLVAKTAGELALQGSGWACAVILGAWSLYLFKELRACDKRVGEFLMQVVAVAEASKGASQGTASALKDLAGVVTSNTTAVQLLAREQEGELREVRHAIANSATIGNAVANGVQQLIARGDR